MATRRTQKPVYVDVTIKHWQDFTGQAATLEGDGRTYDDIAGSVIGNEAETA